MKPPSQNATQVLCQSNFGFTSMKHETTVAKRDAEPFKRFISKRAPLSYMRSRFVTPSQLI